jgi:hypothetical protein
VRNWLADSVRFAWALVYWNARKSAFVRGGRRGQCPCHNPSDDSAPGRVRCEAAHGWRNPARFHAVCPLLVSNEHGWVCSVAPGAVRPFWGRVFAWAGLAALLAYLAAGTAVFAVMRGVAGTPVTWSQVLWPPQWREIKSAQARGFFARAIGAFGAGRLAEAQLALQTAREKDHENREASLLLAQVAMYQGNRDFADGVFLELMQRDPSRRRATALVFHDTLLALGRGGRLAHLALRMAAEDRGHAALWARSLLFGLRMPGDRRLLPELGDDALQVLAPHARRLVRAELLAQSQDAARARAELRQPHPGPFNAVYMRQHVAMMARLGDAAGAQLLLDYYGGALGEFEQALGQYALEMARNDAASALAALRRALRGPLDTARTERLAAALIEWPDAACYRALHAHLLAHPAQAEMADGPSWWLAGLVCGAPQEAGHWRSHGAQENRELYPNIPGVKLGSRDPADPASPVNLVNSLTFPWEVSFALLSRALAPAAR